MKLTEALFNLSREAVFMGDPEPIVRMPSYMLFQLSIDIERELGGTIYGGNRIDGFKFAGIHFQRINASGDVSLKNTRGRRWLNLCTGATTRFPAFFSCIRERLSK